MSQPWYPVILPALPILIVHLAGLVVAIILVIRHKSTPAILALVGFALRFILDLTNFGRSSLIRLLADQMGMRQFLAANTGIGCCCSVIDVIAFVCIIIALWQAVSGAAQAAEQGVEAPQEAAE